MKKSKLKMPDNYNNEMKIFHFAAPRSELCSTTRDIYILISNNPKGNMLKSKVNYK